MTPEPGYKPQRFRVTLEGVTRYVPTDRDCADVTLIIPTVFRNWANKTTNELALGAMPLDNVEWIPEPAKRGDMLTADSPEPPIGSIVLSTYIEDGSAFTMKRDRFGWGPNGLNWFSLMRYQASHELIHVGK